MWFFETRLESKRGRKLIAKFMTIYYNSRNRKRLLCFCPVAIIVLALVNFEVYYQAFQCKVSNKYMEANIRIGVAVNDALFSHKEIPYWLDYATLLMAIRNQTSLNAWEHDYDFSILENDVPAAVKVFREAGLDPREQEVKSRGLLKIFPTPKDKAGGPHTDIWLWNEHMIDGEPHLLLKDVTKSSKRKKKHTFPLRDIVWMKMNVSIPQDSDAILALNFGKNYLAPVTFRVDCINNFFF